MASAIRLAFATDPHYGFDDYDRLGSRVTDPTRDFMMTAKTMEAHAAFILGDLISAKNSGTDCNTMQDYCRTHFRHAATPCHFVVGNNDVKFLDREQFSRITGSPGDSYSLDIGDYHIAILNPDVTTCGPVGPSLTQFDTLNWLAADLAATDKETIILSHIPLDNEKNDPASVTYTLRDNTQLQIWHHYADAAAAREIIRNSGKVRLCMAGHSHRDQLKKIDGIPYIIQQSMAKATADGNPMGRYAVIDICDSRIDMTWFGRQQPSYRTLAPKPRA